MDAMEKIDMSLDDIIKLNKGKGGGRGRGRGGQSRGRGSQGRGGGGLSRGQGRGNPSNRVKGRGPNRYKQLNSNSFQQRNRQQNVPGVSPLNRKNQEQKNSTNQSYGGGRPNQQRPSLKQQRSKAIEAIRKARQTLTQLNSKINRSSLINQKRGIQDLKQLKSKQSRGRGRGLLGLYRQQNSGAGRGRGRGSSIGGRGRGMFNRRGSPSKGRGGGLSNRGRGISNRGRFQLNRNLSSSVSSLSSSNQSQGNRGRRQWRPRQTAADNSVLTVSISNLDEIGKQKKRRKRINRSDFMDSSPEPISNIREQILTLKSPQSQKLVYQKSVFAQSHTNLSLNERFGASSTSSSVPELDGGGRRVFF